MPTDRCCLWPDFLTHCIMLDLLDVIIDLSVIRCCDVDPNHLHRALIDNLNLINHLSSIVSSCLLQTVLLYCFLIVFHFIFDLGINSCSFVIQTIFVNHRYLVSNSH